MQMRHWHHWAFFLTGGRLAKLQQLVFCASFFHGWLFGPQNFLLWPCCWRCWGSLAWRRPSVWCTPCPRSSSPPSSETWVWAAAPWLLGSEPSAPRSSFIWVSSPPVSQEAPPTPSPPLLPPPQPLCVVPLLLVGRYNKTLPYLLMGSLAICGSILCLLLPETFKKPLPETMDQMQQICRSVDRVHHVCASLCR